MAETNNKASDTEKGNEEVKVEDILHSLGKSL